MPDDRIYDAINVFKYSRTGQGNAETGGDAAYRQRFRTLAREVLARLWDYWSNDEIAFVDLGTDRVGSSSNRHFGADIRVNNRLEPTTDPARYATAAEQGKLAGCSCNLVHEATHQVRHIASYPEEEVLCRTIQQFYFRELMQGRSYRSRVTGTRCTAKYLSSTPFYQEYQWRMSRLESQDLIDTIINTQEYRRDLESAATAAFIVRSLPWWGGLRRRWPSTKGYYLRSLASQNRPDYAEPMLRILESISAADWRAARSCAGSLERIRRVFMMAGNHLPSSAYSHRIPVIQDRFGENFGAPAVRQH